MATLYFDSASWSPLRPKRHPPLNLILLCLIALVARSQGLDLTGPQVDKAGETVRRRQLFGLPWNILNTIHENPDPGEGDEPEQVIKPLSGPENPVQAPDPIHTDDVLLDMEPQLPEDMIDDASEAVPTILVHDEAIGGIDTEGVFISSQAAPQGDPHPFPATDVPETDPFNSALSTTVSVSSESQSDIQPSAGTITNGPVSMCTVVGNVDGTPTFHYIPCSNLLPTSALEPTATNDGNSDPGSPEITSSQVWTADNNPTLVPFPTQDATEGLPTTDGGGIVTSDHPPEHASMDAPAEQPETAVEGTSEETLWPQITETSEGVSIIPPVTSPGVPSLTSESPVLTTIEVPEPQTHAETSAPDQLTHSAGTQASSQHDSGPSGIPPSEEPPSEEPPSEAPPSEAPPSEEPPSEAPPSEAPPSEAPPSEAPPSEAPPNPETTPHQPPHTQSVPHDGEASETILWPTGPAEGSSLVNDISSSEAAPPATGHLPPPSERPDVPTTVTAHGSAEPTATITIDNGGGADPDGLNPDHESSLPANREDGSHQGHSSRPLPGQGPQPGEGPQTDQAAWPNQVPEADGVEQPGQTQQSDGQAGLQPRSEQHSGQPQQSGHGQVSSEGQDSVALPDPQQPQGAGEGADGGSPSSVNSAGAPVPPPAGCPACQECPPCVPASATGPPLPDPNLGPCPGRGYSCSECLDGWFCPPRETPMQRAPCGWGWPCYHCEAGWYCVPGPSPTESACPMAPSAALSDGVVTATLTVTRTPQSVNPAGGEAGSGVGDGASPGGGSPIRDGASPGGGSPTGNGSTVGAGGPEQTSHTGSCVGDGCPSAKPEPEKNPHGYPGSGEGSGGEGADGDDGNGIVAKVAPEARGWKYLGCFNDTPRRTLDCDPNLYFAGNMTNEKCIAHCEAKGYKLAGTEYTRECWCGNMFRNATRLPEARCHMACDGNPADLCGGNWAMTVYSKDGIAVNVPIHDEDEGTGTTPVANPGDKQARNDGAAGNTPPLTTFGALGTVPVKAGMPRTTNNQVPTAHQPGSVSQATSFISDPPQTMGSHDGPSITTGANSPGETASGNGLGNTEQDGDFDIVSILQSLLDSLPTPGVDSDHDDSDDGLSNDSDGNDQAPAQYTQGQSRKRAEPLARERDDAGRRNIKPMRILGRRAATAWELM